MLLPCGVLMMIMILLLGVMALILGVTRVDHPKQQAGQVTGEWAGWIKLKGF